MSELVNFARREIALAGLDKPDSDYDGELAKSVMELVEVFAKQGHSGGSAAQTIRIFKEVAMYNVLTPLTGADDEWNDVGDGLWQNKRQSSVFKTADGKAHDNDAVVFMEEDGTLHTNINSRKEIHFPYTPALTIERKPSAEPEKEGDV